MTSLKAVFVSGVVLLFVAVVLGCGSSNPAAPLSAFQPQIANNPDNFQFQATAVQNVTAVVQYTWSNSGLQATVNHSSAVDSGTTVVQLFDANNTEVYSSALLASGTPATTAGVTGNWRIRVTLSNVYGTLNFRAQKL
jgi:hypothetical protein